MLAGRACLAGIIAGRLGAPHRCSSLADPGVTGVPPLQVIRASEAGDPLLREALFMAAEQASKFDLNAPPSDWPGVEPACWQDAGALFAPIRSPYYCCAEIAHCCALDAQA